MSAVHIFSKSQNRHLNYNFVTSASSRGLFERTLTDVRTASTMVVTNETTNSTILKNAARLSLLKWALDRDREDMHLFLQTIVLERDNDFIIVIFHHLTCEKKIETQQDSVTLQSHFVESISIWAKSWWILLPVNVQCRNESGNNGLGLLPACVHMIAYKW